jgi:hypothetical protein
MRVLAISTILIGGLVGCHATTRSEGGEYCVPEETPASQVQSPPANEAAVMSTVPAGPQQFVVTWKTTLVDASNDVSVTLARGTGEAIVSDRGETATETCVIGNFLRIPYVATVIVGLDHAVGSGLVYVQADDADPPAVFVDTPNGGLVSQLSDSWGQVAELEIPADAVTYEWLMFLNGYLSTYSLLIVDDHEHQDGGNGRHVLWRGDLVPSE